MIEIYRKSFRFLRESAMIFGLIALLFEGIRLFVASKSSGTGILAGLFIVTYFMHRHFLFGETFAFKSPAYAKGVPAPRFGKFMVLSCLLLFVPIALGIIVLLIMPFDLSRDQMIGVTVLFFLPAYLLALGLFGTILPAAVTRDPAYRLSLGIKAGLQTMGRLIAGPGVVGLVIYALGVSISFFQQSHPALQSPVIDFAINSFFSFINFFPTILAVAVLCQTYTDIMAKAGAMTGPGTNTNIDPDMTALRDQTPA